MRRMREGILSTVLPAPRCPVKKNRVPTCKNSLFPPTPIPLCRSNFLNTIVSLPFRHQHLPHLLAALLFSSPLERSFLDDQAAQSKQITAPLPHEGLPTQYTTPGSLLSPLRLSAGVNQSLQAATDLSSDTQLSNIGTEHV